MAIPVNSIYKLHWGLVPRHLAPLQCDAHSVLLAIWPAPHNDDECFRLAGFTDFISDYTGPVDSWTDEWRSIVERAIDGLTAYGVPRMRQRVEVEEVQARSFLERLLRTKPPMRPVELSIIEQVILLTEDDQFPDAVVDFGEDSTISLRTFCGHAILWVTINDSVCLDRDAFLTALADGRPVERMDLKWKHLVGVHDIGG